jgi:tetratricopeptide (TPR) repeat protein
MVGPGSRVFGKYEVVRRIAVGGMGEIFLARQTGVVDRLVILKSLLPQLASDAQALAQFLDEARILGSINHPNVCALFDVGEWESIYFIAMEYINGVDLSQILKFCEENKKRLPPLTSAHIVKDAAMGLDAAHVATDASGVPLRVVHRDISPHNIMVRQDGLAKVVDFGVAVAENRLQKTETGLLKGKLGYMPPEQIKGAPVDPKADQFSLGVCLWEMLTQRRLFIGDNAAQVFMKILKEPVVAPSSLVQDIPKEIDAIVLRMTANEPVDRFARLADAATAIRRVLEQYKSPDNAPAQLIRATVGTELTNRQKEFAQAVRPEIPAGMTPMGTAATVQQTPSSGSTAGAFCGSCGTQALAGDRFCRVCGATIGTGTDPSGRAPGPPSSGTGAIPRVDVLSRTGVVRREDASSASGPSESARISSAPSHADVASVTAECAVVAGLIEVLKGGAVGSADATVIAAAADVLRDVGERAGAPVDVRADGRFTLTWKGDDAVAAAVAVARGAVRSAARIGHDVMLRMAVAVDTIGDQQLPSLVAVADVLVDNCAPGSAIIVDGARVKGGNPPTTRSANVRLPQGSVVAHELELPRRLVGRAADVALIDSALDAVESTSKAQQLMLLGDAGIGKTAIVEVGVSFARDRGFVVGVARGARVAEAIALDVLRQLVRDVSADLLRHEQLTGNWSRAIDVIGLPDAVASRMRKLIDDQPDPGLADVPPTRRRAVVKAAVLAFFTKLTERAPVALFVDDIHKGDQQSFEIIAELAARLGSQRLFVLAAGKPVQGERMLPLAKRVVLAPLSPHDTVAVAGLLLGAPVIAPLAGVLVSRANGNPFVLTLVLRQLSMSRQLAMSPNGMQLAGAPDRLNLAPTASGLIHANHAALPAEAQSVLLAAAHLGQVFEIQQLFRIVDGVKDIGAVLKMLTEYGITESLAHEQWAFRSATELAAIPDRLDAMQARRLQQRVADVLAKDAEGGSSLEASERLAAHLGAAEARQKAAEVSLVVAERAMGMGLFELAADHFKRAMAQDWRALSAQPGNEERAARVLLDAALCTAATLEVDAGAAVDIVAPVLKGVPPLLAVHARVEAFRQRGLAFARAKRFSEAEGCFDEALETLQGEYNDGLAAGVLVDLASTLEQRGEVESALSQLQEALRLLGKAPVDKRDRAYDGLFLVGRLGLRQRQFESASQALHAAIAEARRTRRATAEADAHAMLANVEQAQGNVEAAVVATEAAIVIAEGIGDPILEARLRQQLGRSLVALGRRGDAAAALSLALDAARRGQWDEGISSTQQLLAVVGG